MNIYEGRVYGFSLFSNSFDDEDIAIIWPCGKQTEPEDTTLFSIGNAIGEHAIECEVCENVGTTAGRRKASSP